MNKDYIKAQQDLTAKKLAWRKVDGRINKANADRLRQAFCFIEPLINKELLLADIGARDGWFLKYAASKRCKRVVGLDISPAAVQWMKQKGLNARLSDAHELSLKNKECGTICITHVLEHCPDPQKVVNEIYRALKMNGVVYVEIPIEKIPNKEEAHFIGFKNGADLLKLFDESKFELLKCNPEADKVQEGQNFKCVFRKIK